MHLCSFLFIFWCHRAIWCPKVISIIAFRNSYVIQTILIFSTWLEIVYLDSLRHRLLKVFSCSFLWNCAHFFQHSVRRNKSVFSLFTVDLGISCNSRKKCRSTNNFPHTSPFGVLQTSNLFRADTINVLIPSSFRLRLSHNVQCNASVFNISLSGRFAFSLFVFPPVAYPFVHLCFSLYSHSFRVFS